MTEKLYYSDSYTKEFTAHVLECRAADGRFEVVLDRTAFFPEGGGQGADTGVIGDATVLDVQISKDGVITHYTDKALSEGTEYPCRLDFEKRLRRMQNHTGEHIVSGLVHSMFGYVNVGFHLGSEDVTMDYNGVLTREDILKVEYLANRICADNRKVKVYFPSPEELKRLEYRSKLELTNDVRIVEIPDCDVCACCAPHVERTGAVGMIKLLDFIKYKGGVRLHMKCGLDALEDFNDKYRNVASVAERLSVKQTAVSEAVLRLETELSEKKRELSALRARAVTEKISALDFADGNLLVFEQDIDDDTARAAANVGRDKCGGVFGIFVGSDEVGYRYVLTSNTVKLRAFVKENISLPGGGGGSDDMMRGMFKCDREEIRREFGIRNSEFGII